MTNPHRGIFEHAEVPDNVLEARCSATLARLAAMNDSDVLAALAVPREIHKALYQDLIPPESSEIVGNFRGSDYSSLRDALVFFSFNETEGTTNIAGPHKVHELMDEYATMMNDFGLRKFNSLDQKLTVVAVLMDFFGAIHPFLNGNGHVQRITAQCLIERAGYRMTSAWRVHPCPYGEDFHRALAARDVAKVAAMLKGFVA